MQRTIHEVCCILISTSVYASFQRNNKTLNNFVDISSKLYRYGQMFLCIQNVVRENYGENSLWSNTCVFFYELCDSIGRYNGTEIFIYSIVVKPNQIDVNGKCLFNTVLMMKAPELSYKFICVLYFLTYTDVF